MFQNFLLLNVSEFSGALSSDSIVTPVVELINNDINIKIAANNWGFIIFFVCFFIIVSVISSRNKFLLYLFSRLYRNKERNSMFYETLTNESLSKIFLSFQTIILLSIIFYCYAIHANYLTITKLTDMLLFLGKISLVLVIFFLYKFLTYSSIGIIFFNKEMTIQWNDDFLSLISINGIFLFLPALIIFYVETLYTFCLYFLSFYLFLNLIFIFYKIFTIFFYKKQRLLYFILYLCAQEIIPLYLVYRGFVYLIEQKETIWM